ncbi:PAS domain S-box protein [Curvibacter sp. APW13]|uniref:PAS domain-containing protein n=1 Tax=Curvibacter sp. APW13 TaxID=3077236 RepID=UPI0028DDF68B|nr:PAS domain-containing protein [Curvibacter sp. APW13]MDT8992304.1 PAS domain S-box protein [Curvibacter sp. APW13]
MKSVSPLSSLQTRLTAAVLAVFVGSVWVFWSWLSSSMRDDEQHLARLQLRAALATLVTQVDGALDIRFRALERVAEDLGRRTTGASASDRAVLKERPVLQTLFNGGVFTVGTNGMMRARWPDPPGQDARWKALDGAGALSTRRVSVAFEDNAWWLWLLVPVASAHATGPSHLVGRERLDDDSFLQGILRRNKVGANVEVKDSDMQWILARSALPGSALPEGPWLGDEPSESTAGAVLRTDIRGGQWLVDSSPTDTAPWLISIRASTEQVFAGVNARQHQMLLATLFLTAFAGSLIWWLIRFQFAPIRQAIGDLAALASSSPPVGRRLSTVRSDEVGVLIAGFNRVLDVVDRNAMALRQSERRLADILDHMDSFVYLKDRQGRYLFANRSLCLSVGKTLPEIMGLHDYELFEREHSDRMRANDQWVFLHGRTLRTDDTVRMLDREGLRTFLTTKLPIFGDDGSVEMLCGISTDITERTLVETELRIAAAAFECQEGIVVLASDLSVIRVNSALCALTGYTPASVLEPIQAYVSALVRDTGKWAAIRISVAQTGAWRGEMSMSRADGRALVALVTVSAVRDGGGRYGHYVVNLLDVTQAKLQEQQRLQQESSHRLALVREVHHRIKNNLQGIVALLRQHASANPAWAASMQEAIGQVQAMSTIHGLKGRSAFAQMRLCELVDAIAEEISIVWKRTVSVERALPWKPWCLAESESVPLALIVHELLLNAVKHSPDAHSEIALQVRRSEDGQGVELWLRNCGQWPQKDSSQLSQGSGLGLIAVLMPRHGAQLRRWQEQDTVCTLLQLQAPVITAETGGG